MTSGPGPLHILVPAYGPSPYLRETLRSAVVAADEATSITVVDDGSPGDDVRATTLSAGARVEYVRLEFNGGVAAAFQACLRLSRGDYTVLLGSDDLLEPSYVDEVRRLAERYERPAMVHPGVDVVGAAGQPARPLGDRVKSALAPRSEGVISGDRLAASLLTGNWLYFPAIAWRTDVLRRYGFRQDMQTALDLDLELRMAFDGEALAWSPTPAFHYRRHPASASARTAVSRARFREENVVFAQALSRARELGWRRSSVAARLHATSRLHATLASASGVVRHLSRR